MSRVIPDGYGQPNEAGLKFYSDLIDEMLKYGIEPYLTLYHWDLPQKLFERGGWLSPDMPMWFYAYAKLIGERFGDRVKHFITINEPSNIIEGMTPNGTNAPALGYSLKDRLTAVHNVLKSHGMAVRALRETVQDAKIGFAPCSGVPCPPADDPALIEKAREQYFSFSENDLTGGVVPESLYWGPRFLYERYKKPICIMENGFAWEDKVSEDGHVHDPERSEFIKKYTSELLRAKKDGIDICGYFYWSITDNLEWELGFGPRFGMIHVDYDTLVRTPKDSYYVYQDIIASSEV